MARPAGVVIVSERFWAFAGVDGSLREGVMPLTRFDRVPLLRGLLKLVAAFAPIFRRSGVARRRDRWILAALMVVPFGFVFLPATAGWIAWVLVTVALLAWVFRGRTLRLHGAEHRAIAAVEERRLAATWAGESRPSRFSLRCGTNFAALVLPVTVLADRAWPLAPTLYTPFLVTVLALALTMELWRAVQAAPRRVARLLLLPGLGLQRLTTREPSLDQLEVSIRALREVLHLEGKGTPEAQRVEVMA
jgi:hypothetical protein